VRTALRYDRRLRAALAFALVLGWIGQAQQKDLGLHPAVNPVAVNRSQRRDVWMARHEELKARAAKGDIDLLFIGDSITACWESAKV